MSDETEDMVALVQWIKEQAERELSETRDRLLIELATKESDLASCERVNARLQEELKHAKFDLLAAKHWGSESAMDAATREKAAAWDWCEQHGFPNFLWSPEKSVWFYSTFPRFDTPLEAVKAARND